MSKPHVRMRITNFGPIAKGTVDIRPLTLLIGGNSSGKSYTARLYYLVAKALREEELFYGFPLQSIRASSSYQSEKIDSEAIGDWHNYLASDSFQSYVSEVLQDIRQDVIERIKQGLLEYFACETASALIRRAAKKKTANITFETSQGESIITLKVWHRQSDPKVELFLPDLDTMYRLLKDSDLMWLKRRYDRLRGRDEETSLLERLLAHELARLVWSRWLDSVGFPAEVHYLPAGRSGLLEGWQTLASLAVGIVGRRAGVLPIELPKIPGVSRDFLMTFLSEILSPSIGRASHVENCMNNVASILEKKLLYGTIQLDNVERSVPMIVYQEEGLSLPLQGVSSMIAEVAPLVLWVRTVLRPGSQLIIDEPEAHLHPWGQRVVVNAFARLVRCGVRVLCPTHSSIVLHQASNHILLGRLSEQVREKYGYDKLDYLSADEVSVALFARKSYSGPVCVEAVEVDNEFGIDESEFVRIAEEIGEESWNLTRELGQTE